MARQRFASEWGKRVPDGGACEITIVCPNCGGAGAAMDRVSNRAYGWHDRCGWTDSMRVVRVDGRVILEPWS